MSEPSSHTSVAKQEPLGALPTDQTDNAYPRQ